MHYNKTKGGVDSHDLKFALFTTARKTNRWPMRLFYGMLDSFIVDAYVILLAKRPAYSSYSKDKRVYFMKSVASSLISLYAQQRLQPQQIPKIIWRVIENCGITSKIHELQLADTPTIAKS